ncbi:hypothetical protein [Microlunatus parietis]|uniref:Uncharacterized protein n=1 Tax=Microlunatus parietis TaxID=682979 RepID=A0A7Y9I4P0_9ACTN|nr:hypothetical protein [Microlunatus parietis]NYE70137.1 hypothetical protein [Microlunatus parietis]
MTESKGYLDDVDVELDDGSIVKINFYDPVRLAQDIEAELGRGAVGLAWKRLIVVDSVTPAAMQAAVQAMSPDFFD